MRGIGIMIALAMGSADGALSAGQIAVVPFAIPVGVPVTPVFRPQTFYAYRAYAPDKGPAAAERAAVKTLPGEPEGAKGAPPALKRCTNCHGGEAPKAGLDLTRPEALSERARLESIRRVLSADPAVRMPRGEAHLPPEALGQLIEAIVK